MNIQAGKTKIRSQQIPKLTPTWFISETFRLIHKKTDSQIFETSKASNSLNKYCTQDFSLKSVQPIISSIKFRIISQMFGCHF